MTGGRPPGRDDRAVSVAVTHVLAVGITAILIVGLLTAASGMLTDRSETTVEEGLGIVGNDLASDVESVSRLAANGGTVTVQRDYPATVAGQSYTVEMASGATCGAAADCLVLEASSGERVVIGVDVAVDVAVEMLGGGTIRIGASGTGPTADDPTFATPNVGVGSDASSRRPVGGTADVNRAPIARFDVDPGQVMLGDIVLFNASASQDLDGNVTTYKWDFDGDGTFEQITTEPSAAYWYDDESEIGRNNATLVVVDDDGAAGTTTNSLRVAGLVLPDEADPQSFDADGDGSYGGVEFYVANKHDGVAEITEILVDPENDSIGQLRFDAGDEIVVGDGSVNATLPIVAGGIIEGDWNETPTLPADDSSIYVSFAEFYTDGGGEMDSMDGERITIAVRYTVDGTYYSSRFSISPGPPNRWRNQGDEEETFPECSNVNLKAEGDGGDTFEWSVVANPYNLSYEWKDTDDKTGQLDYVSGVPDGETQYIVVETVVTDSATGHTETVRWKVDIEGDADDCAS